MQLTPEQSFTRDAFLASQREYRRAYEAHQREPSGRGWVRTLHAWHEAGGRLDAAEAKMRNAFAR